MLLAFTLPVFTKRAKREVTNIQNFIYLILGVYHAVRPKGPIDRPEEIGGAALKVL